MTFILIHCNSQTRVLAAPPKSENKSLIFSDLFHFKTLGLSEICPKIFYLINIFYILIDRKASKFGFITLKFFGLSDKIQTRSKLFQGLPCYSTNNCNNIFFNILVSHTIFIPSPIMTCFASCLI